MVYSERSGILRLGLLVAVMVVGGGKVFQAQAAGDTEAEVCEACRQRAEIYEDCGRNTARLLQGWIGNKLDPATNLFSDVKGNGIWDYHNVAADYYSSLVVIAYHVQPELIDSGGALHRTLKSYQSLCLAPSGIPCLYDVANQKKLEEAPLSRLSEWLRDGLVRIAEVTGTENDWFQEFKRLVDAILIEAESTRGLVKSFPSAEGAGNMIQSLTRLYAMSGNEKYLNAAETLADAHLSHPSVMVETTRLLDHGCELIPGIGELFALECQLGRPKAKEYQPKLQTVLEGVLVRYADSDTGLFALKEPTEDPNWMVPPDNWGYLLFTYENYDRGTKSKEFHSDIEKPLQWLLNNRANYATFKGNKWPRSRGSDDWSDSYESMIVLWNRYPEFPEAEVFKWLDWTTLQASHRKNGNKKYGPYSGGHENGSTGRTLCLHMMLCSQNARAVPFQEGLRLGAVEQDGELNLLISTNKAWSGKICFDGPRSARKAAELNWARIDEFPQWFVVLPDVKYEMKCDSQRKLFAGQQLIDGVEVKMAPGEERRIVIRRANGE